MDKCAITGESLPVEVAETEQVFCKLSASLYKIPSDAPLPVAVIIATGGLIKMRAERVGKDTTLSKIIKMVREAGASKAPTFCIQT